MSRSLMGRSYFCCVSPRLPQTVTDGRRIVSYLLDPLFHLLRHFRLEPTSHYGSQSAPRGILRPSATLRQYSCTPSAGVPAGRTPRMRRLLPCFPPGEG